MRSPGPAEGDCFAVWKPGGSLSPAPRAAWALLAVTLETAAGGASGRPPQPGLALGFLSGQRQEERRAGGRERRLCVGLDRSAERPSGTVPSAGHAGTVWLPAERAAVSQEREAC